MKLVLVSILLAASSLVFGQTESISGSSKLYWSQKYGLDPVKEITFTYKVSGDTTFYYTTKENTPENLNKNSFQVTKNTDKYLVGKNKYGGYAFFDIITKQLYVIDYFMSRYSVYAYGKGYSVMKQTVNTMSEKLKGGSSQKDVIAYLISQTEHDF